VYLHNRNYVDYGLNYDWNELWVREKLVNGAIILGPLKDVVYLVVRGDSNYGDMDSSTEWTI